ncbi:MAG: glucosaminidase domain-containing protein [Candidatus Latescibacterota bacterium]|nr:glucosaminidase domain-containing protein [Candidatus Latescibacterota bacterium]
MIAAICFLNFDLVNSQDVDYREITYVDSSSLGYKTYFAKDSEVFSASTWRDLFLKQVTSDTAQVAKRLIVRSPDSVSLRSMPKDMLQLPVAEKKELFFSVMGRIAKFHNDVIAVRRERLIRLLHSSNDDVFLEKMVTEYSLERVNLKMPSRRDTLLELLTRVDCIPPSLILAQAAIESGWGTSRFAREGNNLFGQRVWSDKIPGMEASGRSDAKFRLAVYTSISESVKGYLRNLNTHPFYQSLRVIRKRKRDQDQSVFGLDLVGQLGSYSIRGEAYISDVTRMIEFNNLSQLDEKACI